MYKPTYKNATIFHVNMNTVFQCLFLLPVFPVLVLTLHNRHRLNRQFIILLQFLSVYEALKLQII
jgi:hypothetical protein